MEISTRISNLRRELVNAYNIPEEIQEEIISITSAAKNLESKLNQSDISNVGECVENNAKLICLATEKFIALKNLYNEFTEVIREYEPEKTDIEKTVEDIFNRLK